MALGKQLIQPAGRASSREHQGTAASLGHGGPDPVGQRFGNRLAE